MNRYRNLSSSSKIIFWIILAVMVVIGLIAFFTSQTGRTVALVCCGALVLVVIVGIISESGMSRRR